MVNIKKVLFLFCFVCVVGCQNNPSKTQSEQEQIVVVKDSPVPIRESFESQESITDSSIIKQEEGIELLLPTYYRKESQGYPQGLDKDNWYELFKDSVSGKWFTTKSEFNVSYFLMNVQQKMPYY